MNDMITGIMSGLAVETSPQTILASTWFVPYLLGVLTGLFIHKYIIGRGGRS